MSAGNPSRSRGPDPEEIAGHCRALEQRWHAEIPISRVMGIEVVDYVDSCLRVRAALEPNVNVHGSAFAGSQFSIASLCGWGQIYLQLARRGRQGSIVFVDGSIRCLQPVRAAMQATCTAPESLAAGLDELERSGRARLVLVTTIVSDGALAAEFTGTYGVRLRDQ
ncbi:MAG: YiiD C-terminal domain-containing protein [Pseudomonadales bacterium]